MTKSNRREFLLSLGAGVLVVSGGIKAAAAEDWFEVEINKLFAKMTAYFDSLSTEDKMQYIEYLGDKKTIATLEQHFGEPVGDVVLDALKDVQNQFRKRLAKQLAEAAK